MPNKQTCFSTGSISANLPQKPSKPASSYVGKTNNRIFIRLSEDHPSRNHHIHAIKTALINKLGLEGASMKAIQKVKSEIAIVPTNEEHAELLIGKSQTITSVLGEKVEKAEECRGPYLEKKITKKRPDYDTFGPIDNWEFRPRVITYTKRGRGLQVTQIRPSNIADICCVTILRVTPPITIANVYRPPQETEDVAVMTALKSWQAPSNYLVAGDFNTRHPLWDFRASASRKSEELVEWAETNGLVLASPIDESTHSRGSTLDLVFTNNPYIQCNIEEHLHTTSDHETLLSIVPCAGLKSPPAQTQFVLTSEVIPRFAAGVKETIPPIELLSQDPDELANTIIKSIQINMERFLTRKKQSGQGTKWKQGSAIPEKNALRNTKRAAKRLYWMRQIQDASTPKDIYRITGWRKNKAPSTSPPLRYEDKIYTDASSMAEALRHALLERKTSEEDICMALEQPASQLKVDIQETRVRTTRVCSDCRGHEHDRRNCNKIVVVEIVENEEDHVDALTNANDIKKQKKNRLDALTFATTISLSAVLAELILCEISNALDPVARAYALKSIIPSLLFSLVFLIPFLELQSIISATGWSSKISENDKTPRIAWLLQAAGFSLWLLGFWWLGKGTHIFMTASKSGKGITAACLERVGIIGIALMAIMSGFAAVSAVWHTFGVKPRMVSEADIYRKQADLDTINKLLVDKQNRLRVLQRKTKDMPTGEYLKKFLGTIRGNSDSQELQSLEREISALVYMSSSLSSSKGLLQNRLAYSRRASSRLGKIILVPSSYGFSIYCIYRILSTILTNIRILIFSYPTMAMHNPPSTDPINRILSLMAKHIDPTLNRLAWSRQISILLSGFILLASFNSVLTTFHMLTKFSPSLLHQAQANQALLISHISATYVISSALLLRSNLPNEMKSIVNEALGSPLDPIFVERWFDTWFLLATAGTALGIWVSRRFYGQGVQSWDDSEFEGDIEL
ncbi:hypothetical protein EPUL_004056, partial [Erysiphe pulchra]